MCFEWAQVLIDFTTTKYHTSTISLCGETTRSVWCIGEAVLLGGISKFVSKNSVLGHATFCGRQEPGALRMMHRKLQFRYVRVHEIGNSKLNNLGRWYGWLCWSVHTHSQHGSKLSLAKNRNLNERGPRAPSYWPFTIFRQYWIILAQYREKS